METPDGIELLRSMGSAKGQQGDVEGEKNDHQEACRICEKLGMQETLCGAKVWTAIAEGRRRNGDSDGEMQAVSEARRILTQPRGSITNTLEGETLLARIESLPRHTAEM